MLEVVRVFYDASKDEINSRFMEKEKFKLIQYYCIVYLKIISLMIQITIWIHASEWEEII